MLKSIYPQDFFRQNISIFKKTHTTLGHIHLKNGRNKKSAIDNKQHGTRNALYAIYNNLVSVIDGALLFTKGPYENSRYAGMLFSLLTVSG